MPDRRVSGAIDRIGGASVVVRAVLVAMWLVVAAFTVSTLPGVRSAPGFNEMLDGWLKNLGYVLAAGVVVARAVLVTANRLGWALVAGALVARAFGFVAHWRWVRVLDPVPYPSVADAGWLVSAVLLLAGIVAFAWSGPRWRGWSIALDAMVGALAAAAVFVALLYGTLVELAAPGIETSALVTNLAYPVLDVALLMAVIGVFAAFGWRPPRTLWWLLVGVVGVATIDAVFLYLATVGAWRPGTPWSAVTLATTAVISAAAWVRPRQRVGSSGDVPDVVAPALFALLCIAVLVYGTQRPVSWVAVALAALGLVGTVVRAVVSFRAVRAVGQLERNLNRAEVGQYLVDAATGDHRWFGEVADRLGLAQEPVDAGGGVLWDRIPEADRAAVRAAERAAARSGELDVVHRLIDGQGSVAMVHRRAQARRDIDGQLVGWDGTIQDVTAQHRAANERLELLRRSVASADDERQRLAEQLHDEVVQLLAAAVLRLDLLDGPEERLEQVHGPMAESIRLLRTTIAELAQPHLDPAGFAAAVGDHVARLFEPDGVRVEVASELDGTANVDPEVLVAGYRIVQEALSNVRRHADATVVRVEVRVDGDRLVGEVTDDGVGVDPAGLRGAPERPGHLGLRLMGERAAAVGGAVEVERVSAHGGTTVRWWLPTTVRPVPQLEAP